MSALEFRGVSKRFGSFFANRELSFRVEPGTIHGLIGENGAGKSTAMKALFGIHSIEEGTILIRGKPVRIKNPIQAMKLGIGMVHQHFMLAGPETVLDNIILGREPGFFGINREKALAELENISETYGLQFGKWLSPVDELSVGEQQRVEILKLLYQRSEILILDEPTAVLTPQEVSDLFQNLKRLKDEGKTIILISHKLKEVLAHTDAVTVLRRGECVGTRATSETTEDELAQMMVGRPVSFTYEGERKVFAKAEDARAVLRLDRLSISDAQEPLHKVALELRPAEILGIAGVQGNGQTTLLRFLSNPSRFRSADGEYRFAGANRMGSNPLALRRAGMALVPEDRLAEGLLLHQDLMENYLLGQHVDPRFVSRGMIDRSKVRPRVEAAIRDFDIRPPFVNIWASRLSGGNQQKLVIARALDSNPSVLLIAHPTRGVDVGAIERIHEAIMKERNSGKSILLFSSELDELIDLSDRMLVFFNGSVAAEFQRREFDPWAIGRVMGGGEK
ncbi:MAG: ABC transporter ATP-binding protein [Bdellovibrionales bacterium]|nr:ABC transporter ATP-binding protein [Bdellovibrionales bacterium]